MSKILVTGGSGFIGTNLIEYLYKDNEILNIDIKEPQNINHRHLWKKVDINDFESFEYVVCLFNPDYIIHLAARTDLEGKKINDYNTNIIGVKNVILISKQIHTLKKIIITSSMLVCHTDYTPLHQRDYAPSTIYGQSKCMTEKLVWESELTTDWLIIRPTSIWGPWFDIPYKNFFDMIISSKYFHIGNKSATKTYGYIENSVYQIVTLLKANTTQSKNKVFYIGDYEPYKIENWANEIGHELGKKIRKIPYKLFMFFAKTGDLLNFIGVRFPMTSFRLKNMTTDNIINLEETIKYVPNLYFTRVEGIKKTLEWMKK